MNKRILLGAGWALGLLSPALAQQGAEGKEKYRLLFSASLMF